MENYPRENKKASFIFWGGKKGKEVRILLLVSSTAYFFSFEARVYQVKGR